jgi:hypothetical protein
LWAKVRAETVVQRRLGPTDLAYSARASSICWGKGREDLRQNLDRTHRALAYVAMVEGRTVWRAS